MSEVDFKFRQKSPASKFTSNLSPTMFKPLPREWLLTEYVIREYDPEAIGKAMDYLTPDNFRILLLSKNPVKGKVPDTKEKWYGTEYLYERIPKDIVDELHKTVGPNAPKLEELHLPHRNEFIPTNLEVVRKDVKEPTKSPVLIKNTELMRVWYKKDDTFWVPKANFDIEIKKLVFTLMRYIHGIKD